MAAEPSTTSQVDALATLSLLETRLRRLEFLLTGLSDLNGKPTPVPHTETPLSSKETVSGRVQQLQEDLERLRRLTGPAGDLIRDIESLHSKTPEIFNDPSPPVPTSLSDQATHVFANAPLYTETVSRLSSLQTLKIPPAEQSSELINLRSRIDAVGLKQDELEFQSRELRERSAKCLEWWVQVGVVGMGELWTDWEERVRETERGVNRMEKSQKAMEGYV